MWKLRFRPDAILQGCGAPAQHHILAVCWQVEHGQVYDGEIVYKLYVNMYMHLSCSLYFIEYR